MRFVIVALYLAGAVSLGATPLDDKMKAFEEAVKAAPPTKSDSVGKSPLISRMGGPVTVDDLDRCLKQGANEAAIQNVVARLMAAYSSDGVQQTGTDLLKELETERAAKAEAFEAKANEVLAKVPDALKQAKLAPDLDGILAEMKGLTDRQQEPYNYNNGSLVGERLGAAFQYVTQWQDYLSGMSSGNRQQAQSSLRVLLENRQLDAPSFFPRSELLARLAKASGLKSDEDDKSPSGIIDSDTILDKVKKVDDVQPALDKLANYIPAGSNTPLDWSSLETLDKVRKDMFAGLPATLNLKKTIHGTVWGDDTSRITAMELMVMLPRYFGTEVSDPPKADETVSDYLERLIVKAGADGNLALLQRVFATKVALSNAEAEMSTRGVEQFLAGLSQEAAGQYGAAVKSYQSALRDGDSFLPIKLVGDRLVVIKAAHPDEFQKGMTAFDVPPISMDPSFNFGMPYLSPQIQQMQMQQRLRQPLTITIMPIPFEITIPAAKTTSPDITH